MLAGNLLTVDAVDGILSHAEEKRRHDGVDEVEVVEEEDAQIVLVPIVEALARDWRRAERLGITGGETDEDEVGRSTDVRGRNRRLGRRNCQSAICTT